jgi:hypothetical protein
VASGEIERRFGLLRRREMPVVRLVAERPAKKGSAMRPRERHVATTGAAGAAMTAAPHVSSHVRPAAEDAWLRDRFSAPAMPGGFSSEIRALRAGLPESRRHSVLPEIR